eukprot:COSAG01_NODE_13796_length_1534_cov_1.370035_1_plen_257_part_00
MGRHGGGVYAQLESRRTQQQQRVTAAADDVEDDFVGILATIDRPLLAPEPETPAPVQSAPLVEESQQRAPVSLSLEEQVETLEAELHQSEAAVHEQTRMIAQLQRSREKQLQDLRTQLGLEATGVGADAPEVRAEVRTIQEQLRCEFAAQISAAEVDLAAASSELGTAQRDAEQLGHAVEAARSTHDRAKEQLSAAEERLLLQDSVPLAPKVRNGICTAAGAAACREAHFCSHPRSYRCMVSLLLSSVCARVCAPA